MTWRGLARGVTWRKLDAAAHDRGGSLRLLASGGLTGQWGAGRALARISGPRGRCDATECRPSPSRDAPARPSQVSGQSEDD